MGELTRDLRRRLLTILASLEALDDYARRTALLDDLPRPLVGSIARSSSKALDLEAIVHACAAWQPLPGATMPIETLLENAIAIADGQQAAPDLQALLATLRPPTAPPPPPRALRSSDGIPAGVYSRLRNSLLDCGPFGSEEQVRAVFAHALLRPFRHGLPGASTPAGRVDALLSYLVGKRRADTGANGIVVFLQVLRDQLDPGDSCYSDLATQATDLDQALGHPADH